MSNSDSNSDSQYFIPIPPGSPPSQEEILAEKIWKLLCEKCLIGVPVGVNWDWKSLGKDEERLHVREKMREIARELLGREGEEVKLDDSASEPS